MEIRCIEWDLMKSAWWCGIFCCNTPGGYLECFYFILFAEIEHIFTNYNSCYSLLFSLAGNPQVPVKFWYAYPDLAGPVGTGWSRSVGAWSAGIFWQVTCWYLRITRTRGVPYAAVKVMKLKSSCCCMAYSWKIHNLFSFDQICLIFVPLLILLSAL